MNFLKSHFTFSREQRNGIFLLLLIIILLQVLYFFVDFSSKDVIVDHVKFTEYTKEIDSLRLVKLEEKKTKTYPFSPNHITDFKGATLGMSNKEIDRLLNFRKQDQWINSAKQFQEVTKVSDSLLNKISPLFKFPDWVIKPKLKKQQTTYNNEPKSFAQKQDLNKATEKQLQGVYGVGTTLSKRIIKYRDKYKGGFIEDAQLEDVYGLTPETRERILKEFIVKTPRPIIKIELNIAKVEDLVNIQYIDYDVAYNIIEQRQLREGYKSLDELIKVKDFPVNKIEIIKLYLYLE